MPPVKDNDAESRRGQLFEPADGAVGRGERKARNDLARGGSLALAHGAIISAHGADVTRSGIRVAGITLTNTLLRGCSVLSS